MKSLHLSIIFLWFISFKGQLSLPNPSPKIQKRRAEGASGGLGSLGGLPTGGSKEAWLIKKLAFCPSALLYLHYHTLMSFSLFGSKAGNYKYRSSVGLRGSDVSRG